MKKVLALVLTLGILLTCVATAFAETPYIAIVSKGFQHKFWQTVKAGSDDAATKYGVSITFDGPPSETDVQVQVDMLNAAIAKGPAAICLAALDTESVTEQLLTAKDKGVPVVGFDSGVPNAPEGTIASTVSTDNEGAGALAADRMFAIESIRAAIDAATPESPITLACFSQEANSASIVGRTVGYINEMYALVNEIKPGEVAITGHEKFAKAAEGDKVSVEILVTISASTNPQDLQTAGQSIFMVGNLVSIFCTNSGSVDGVLAATADGSDLDRANGKFKDITVIGFDSGAPLLNAVRNQWFYGAVTQDPYSIGYFAVELAVRALNGETLDPIVGTESQFYTYENMDEPSIAQLLYE